MAPMNLPEQSTDPDGATERAAKELGATGLAANEFSAADMPMVELLYDELRRIAAAHLRRERADHTLSPTGLAHEAWLRLHSQQRAQFKDRGHFLATASMLMRRILVNHAVARRRSKRDALLVPLDATGSIERLEQTHPGADLVLMVNDALLDLAQTHARAAQVVEMKFFGGLEHADIALALNTSVATVKREWQFARVWLHRAMQMP